MQESRRKRSLVSGGVLLFDDFSRSGVMLVISHVTRLSFASYGLINQRGRQTFKVRAWNCEWILDVT